MVGGDLEELQDLAQHPPVLDRDAQPGIDLRVLGQGPHHRRHLDGVRAGTEHGQDFDGQGRRGLGVGGENGATA